MKNALRETQTLRAGGSIKAEPKIFAPPHTPFVGARDGQNLISWRWSLYLYLQTQFRDSASPDPLFGFKEPTSKGRGREGEEGGEGRVRKKERGGRGKGKGREGVLHALILQFDH